MVPREKVHELVKAHATLEEPTTGAIWFKKDASEVWLVEVIPSMSDDDAAAEPTYLNPGVGFRFPLALVAGNRKSLETALRSTPGLAREVAEGEVVHGGDDVRELLDLAREFAGTV